MQKQELLCYFSRGRARRCPASEPVKHPFQASGPSPQATLNGPDALLFAASQAVNSNTKSVIYMDKNVMLMVVCFLKNITTK